MNKKQIIELINEITDETSYRNKPYKEALKNITKWEKKLLLLDLPNDDINFMNYILNSRKQNIKIILHHINENSKDQNSS